MGEKKWTTDISLGEILTVTIATKVIVIKKKWIKGNGGRICILGFVYSCILVCVWYSYTDCSLEIWRTVTLLKIHESVLQHMQQNS